MCVYMYVIIGLGQEASTSTVDMDIGPGSETECRDRGLGGTLEVNTEDCFMETPMMSMANQTGDSSCPFWLRKVSLKESTKQKNFVWILETSETLF